MVTLIVASWLTFDALRGFATHLNTIVRDVATP